MQSAERLKADAQQSKLVAILNGRTDGLHSRAPKPEDDTSKPIFSLPTAPHTRPLDRLSATRAEIADMSLTEHAEVDGMRNLIQVRAMRRLGLVCIVLSTCYSTALHQSLVTKFKFCCCASQSMGPSWLMLQQADADTFA